MDPFEIHITSKGPEIHGLCELLGLKTIEIDLLRPDGSVLRTEHMTSEVFKCEDFGAACSTMTFWCYTLEKLGVEIIRTKIETPPFDKYLDRAIYMESHFKDDSYKYPTSRSKHSNKLLATDRNYDLRQYGEFIKKHVTHETELCLHDSWVDEDLDWFELWPETKG